MPIEAGNGEHRAYRVVIESGEPLRPNEDYLGIDAVAWFVNKQSSWFSDRMVSGTLDIKISEGAEQYQAALGTFDLGGGSRLAPVFDRAVLPDRNYRGGSITLGAALTSIKKDTVVAALLKSAANASLGVAAGMVQTATAAGPVRLLGAAGEELMNGVKRVLSDTGEKREALFDFSGFEVSLQPDRIVGKEIYVLLHRGTPFPETALTVRSEGQLIVPYVNDAVLDDGAWLLLRLRRSSEYSGQREWYTVARALRGRILALLNDFKAGLIGQEEALERLATSSTGTETLFDEFARLRALIFNDGVLSEREAGLHIGQLRLAIDTTRKAIKDQRPDMASEVLQETKRGLLSGRGLPPVAVPAYETE
ncbi:MAG: hypothetical protein ACRD7E_10695, partial [Bryobacteraceae bacterium]